MNTWQRFEHVCRAMSDPAIYPHPVSHLERRDTHISAVFLTGQWAYKIKKPVVFDFLDFRDLNDRKRFCEQEVSLNKRFSQDVYIGVIGIYEDQKNRISLQSKGRIIEYAVKMVQLPVEANLKALLQNNLIRETHMESLGRVLSDFYRDATQSSMIDQYGRQEVIAYNMEENFREIEPFAAELLNAEQWKFICNVNRAFLKDHYDLFEHRIQTGRIRDGHGDLRTDHVYFYNGIQVIDCIEFNDRFRFGDVALDLAFLHMDLEHLGYPDVSRELIKAYADNAGDPEIYALLNFFSAYRAIIRLKVSCFQYGELEKRHPAEVKNEIQLFMDQAYQYTILFGRPTLWVFCGLPATGKSTLAKRTAAALFISLFQSDMVRKQDQPEPHPEIAGFDEGLYRPMMRGRVYAHLLAMAQDELKSGKSVVLDATFSTRKWREAVRQLALDIDAGLIFVECTCKTDTIRSRLKQRENVPGDSDARLTHFQQLIEKFEPFQTHDPKTHFKIDTDRRLDQVLIEVLSKGYACKRAQIRAIL